MAKSRAQRAEGKRSFGFWVKPYALCHLLYAKKLNEKKAGA